MGRLVVGVDGGTESLRAAVFDADTGAIVGASCACAYETQYPQPGWAEQRPEDWWDALGSAVSSAVKSSGAQLSDISAICLDTTCCTVVALDAEARPLRPALLWMDQRSADQARRVAECGDVALKVNGAGHGPVSPEWMVPKSLWIKENEPEVWKAARTVCEFQDYLNYRLTGNMCASANNAAVRWHCSSGRGPPHSLMAKMDFPELADKWPTTTLALGAEVGRLTAAAAAHLGLSEGMLVAQGGADAFIGMIGLGVVRPGQMALLTGSSHLQLGLVDKEVHGPGIFGTYSDAVIPGLHVIEGGQTSTGSIVNWFKRNLVPPEVGYDTLNAEAATVPPGCEGLSCLDHFQGNRTPHTDPLSRGALVGLTLRHGRAHIFRGLMESVAFGTRLILEKMAERGYRPDSIVIAGGAVRSQLWLQIHSDVCNLPFVLTKETEAPMLGCAVLAAVAAGLYPDVTTAVRSMVHVDRVVQPDPVAHKQYQPHYEQYIGLYPALKSTFHRTRADPARKRPTEEEAGERTEQRQKQRTAGSAATQAGAVCLSASILAADFANLGSEVAAAMGAGCEWIHCDIFDGCFVDALTIGPPVVQALRRRHPAAFLDCHLCVQNPANYVAPLAAAGASQMTFHAEVLGCELEKMRAMTAAIRSAGMRVGVALAPETGAQVVHALVSEGLVDLVLCMTVTPGFGGQKLLPQVLAKVASLRSAFPELEIQCDGGINAETAAAVAAAGATSLVAGSAVFPPVAAGTAECEKTRLEAIRERVHRIRLALAA